LRVMPLNKMVIGKALGKTIYTEDGRVLLQAGTPLTERFIRRLRQKGYTAVYVRNELSPDLEIDDAINEATRVRAVKETWRAMQSASNRRPLDVSRINEVVSEIIDDLRDNSDLVFSLSTLRTHDDYTFVHSVNVCVLSLILGHALYYDYGSLKTLGVGALLHDIGKTQIPVEILRKPGQLSADEYDQMKRHAQEGFDILREHFEINLFSAHVAFQHHERYDGSGYPRGLKGDEIHEFARIASVADSYDALTSGRPYHGRVLPHDACRTLVEREGSHYAPRIVHKLIERVAAYPVGTIVKLETGEIAVVVAQEKENSTRPRTRVVTDSSYKLVEPYEVSLAEESSLEVNAVLLDFPDKVKAQLRRQGLSEPPPTVCLAEDGSASGT